MATKCTDFEFIKRYNENNNEMKSTIRPLME